MAAETIKLVLIWLHCLHALLCIAFIADLILILLLSGFYRWFCGAARQICFNQSEALPRSGQWYVISMEFLHPFFRRQFAGKSVGRRLFSKALLFREGPGGPAPLIFRPKWGPKGGKKFFWRPPPPLISGSGWPPHTRPPPPPPLSEGLDSPLIVVFIFLWIPAGNNHEHHRSLWSCHYSSWHILSTRYNKSDVFLS